MSGDSIVTNLRGLYPEVGAGGYSRCDGTIEFYLRINSLASKEMAILDYGAGRGAQISDSKSEFRANLCKLQGKVERIAGVDIDPAVLTNPFMDEAHQISPDSRLPFPDNSFDLIYADWVLEHVAQPQLFASEVDRLLKSGGWFCARTPNRWGMVGLAANLVPNEMHKKFLSFLQPARKDIDVFPTTYRMNTLGAILKLFPKDKWKHCSYAANPEPPYVQRSTIAMRFVQVVWRLLPPHFNTVLNVFVQKK